MTEGLLLIHAFPLDAGMWQGQVEGFAGRLPVVAPHLPGFGGTAPAGDVMTMGAAADRCVASALPSILHHGHPTDPAPCAQ